MAAAAAVERRRDHFVLADHSSNGTFVTLEGRPVQVAEFRCVETWKPELAAAQAA